MGRVEFEQLIAQIESALSHVHEAELFSLVDRLLDEIRSDEQFQPHAPRIVDCFLKVLKKSNWHLAQTILCGLIHLVKGTTPPILDEYLDTSGSLISAISEFVVDKKREVRDAAAQLIGGISSSSHPKHGVLDLLNKLAQRIATAKGDEPSNQCREGFCMALGYLFMNLTEVEETQRSTLETLLEKLICLTKYNDSTDFSNHIRRQAIRALDRLYPNGQRFFAGTLSNTAKIVIRDGLRDQDIDVRKVAAKLFITVSSQSSDSFCSALRDVLNQLAEAKSWEERHGLCWCLLEFASKQELITLVDNMLDEIYKSLTSQICYDLCNYDDPPSVTSAANAAAASAMFELFANRCTYLESSGETDAESHCVQVFGHFILPQIHHLFSASEPLLLDAAGRGVQLVAQSPHASIVDHLDSLLLMMYKNNFHSSNSIQAASKKTFGAIFGDNNSQNSFIERSMLSLDASTTTNPDIREASFKAMAHLFEFAQNACLARTRVASSPSLLGTPVSSPNTSSASIQSISSSSSSSSLPRLSFSNPQLFTSDSIASSRTLPASISTLLRDESWQRKVWQGLIAGISDKMPEETAEFPQAAALDALHAYIIAVASAVDLNRRGSSIDVLAALSPRSHLRARGIRAPPLRDVWTPTNPSVQELLTSVIRGILVSDSENLIPPALRVIEAIAYAWGRQLIDELAGLILMLSKISGSSSQFDAIKARLSVLGSAQTLTLKQLELAKLDDWLDPDVIEDEDVRKGALSALLHVAQRLNVWDDEGNTVSTPIMPSKLNFSELDEVEGKPSHVNAFKILLRAVAKALCIDENRHIAEMQAKGLAILCEFQKLQSNTVAEFVSSDSQTQALLRLILCSVFYQIIGKQDEFTVDPSDLFDETADFDVSIPADLGLERIQITEEVPYFFRLIMFGTVCGYFLPLMANVEVDSILHGLTVLLRTLIKISPHYASAIPLMGKLSSFDVIKDLNIKDFDISEILAFVKDTSTAAGKILAFERELESEAQTGSLELAEKALKLAVDISAATSDSLHRIMVSHLLNLFHTQLNLVGLKNIPATQLRDYFKQLMLVIPTDEEDVDEDIAVFMTLSKGTDPVHGLEFGPFDVKFLAVSVFGITDDIWECMERVRLLTTAMDDIHEILSDNYDDEQDTRNMRLLSHCVSQPYFDSQLEAILLPSCMEFITKSESIDNEHYKYITRVVREIVWTWDRQAAISHERASFVELLKMCIAHRHRLTSSNLGSSLVDLCYICSCLLYWSTADEVARQVLQLLSDVLSDDNLEETTRLQLEPLLEKLAPIIDPLFLPRAQKESQCTASQPSTV